jgi:hypothetical protein
MRTVHTRFGLPRVALALAGLPLLAAVRLALPAVPALPAVVCSDAMASPAADVQLVGSGKPVVQTRSLPAFHAVSLTSSVDLELRVGPAQRVDVVGDDNLVPLVTTVVRDGSLTLGMEPRAYTTRNALKAIVTVPSLDAVAIRGSGDARIDDISSKSFAVAIVGSGDVVVCGKAGSVALSVQGSGDIRAQDLRAETAAVDLKGSGDIAVHASQTLAINLRGSGDITVFGKPKSVVRNVHGSGDIRMQ